MNTFKKHIAPINRAMPLMPWLDHHGACAAAKEVAQETGWTTLGEAWDQCTNVGWLLWGLAEEGYSDEPVLRLFACRCVRETPLSDGRVVADLLTDARSWAAVDTAERFAQGQASSEELAVVCDAAWAAAERFAHNQASAEDLVAARAAAWATTDAATWAAQAAAQSAAEKTAWAVAWAAQAAAQAAGRKAVWMVTWTTAQAATLAVAEAAWAAAAEFQADILRQMIDPFQSDRS